MSGMYYKEFGVLSHALLNKEKRAVPKTFYNANIYL